MSTIDGLALAYWILYYGLLLVFRAYVLYRNTGVNAIQNRQTDGLAGFAELVFKVCFILIPVLVLNYVFIPQNYQYFVPIQYLSLDWLNVLGGLLGIGGILFAFIAQLQMGNSWRLGLDHSTTTELVTKGFYQFSRNPIYLGVLVATFGFFLLLPSAASLGLLVANYIGLEVKIRLEEQFMAEQHQADYLTYQQRVRRWL